jgi:hypothetical protein
MPSTRRLTSFIRICSPPTSAATVTLVIATLGTGLGVVAGAVTRGLLPPVPVGSADAGSTPATSKPLPSKLPDNKTFDNATRDDKDNTFFFIKIFSLLRNYKGTTKLNERSLEQRDRTREYDQSSPVRQWSGDFSPISNQTQLRFSYKRPIFGIIERLNHLLLNQPLPNESWMQKVV